MKPESATRKKRKVNLGRYVDALSDSSFKRIFGQEPNKDVLIDFLNQLLKSKGKQITELTYNKNEYPSSLEDGRHTICDLTCTGNKGERFIIEVQKVHKEYFKDRTIFYVSSLIDELGMPGRVWDYELPEVYFIALMDFTFKDSRTGRYLHWVHLREDDLPEIFYKKLSYLFVEIPSFNKGLDELDSELDKWLYILKNMSKLREIPGNLE
jgi:predicted transposase/invertase (TIGR01784 family)